MVYDDRAGLEKYWETFEQEGIVTYDVVCELDENMMRELGLNMGERIKLVKALRATQLEVCEIMAKSTSLDAGA